MVDDDDDGESHDLTSSSMSYYDVNGFAQKSIS